MRLQHMEKHASHDTTLSWDWSGAVSVTTSQVQTPVFVLGWVGAESHFLVSRETEPLAAYLCITYFFIHQLTMLSTSSVPKNAGL